MQINGTLQGSARTYLTHIFGRGLDDEPYVVERFAEARFDAGCSPCHSLTYGELT